MCKPAGLLFLLLLLACSSGTLRAQGFFPLRDVHPGLRGTGRTVFQGNQIEDFQVEILGVLENLTPKQTIIIARLSGGPLERIGVMQGMSGSPVYIDGKLLGAVALGFPFSKEPIAGIQPIEQMIADSTFTRPAVPPGQPAIRLQLPQTPAHSTPAAAPLRSGFGDLTAIWTPVSFSGFTSRTLQNFGADLRSMGFEPQQGVSAGSPKSPAYTGKVVPGSMISVQLLSGDMSMSADGTVTYVDGNRVYAFGHRFLDVGSTELPFARSDVVALLPTLNTSFKLSAPREWVGSILSDRSTAIAGEMGRPAHTIPTTISVRSQTTGNHDYHFQVINNRLLTPFITQLAIFSTIDATERTVGVGTLRLHGRIEFEDNLPPLKIADIFVSDSGLAQQVANDAVVTLGFVLGAGFRNLRVKNISYTLDQLDAKHQLHISQFWASAHQARPGDTLQLTTLLRGEDGVELTRTATYKIPTGAPAGPLNFTVSDAATLNAPDFAGLTQNVLHSPQQLISVVNAFRGSEAAYVRVWRQQPAFSVIGPFPRGDITDPPPSVALVLADPSASANSNAAMTVTRGSEITEIDVPMPGYVVTGAKTVQVQIAE